MSVTIHLPSVLRRMTDDQAKVEVEGGTVEDAVHDLCTRYEDLAKHLLDDDGNVRQHVTVFREETGGVEQVEVGMAVEDGDVLRLVPAIAGG